MINQQFKFEAKIPNIQSQFDLEVFVVWLLFLYLSFRVGYEVYIKCFCLA